jgi:hypothetical protein
LAASRTHLNEYPHRVDAFHNQGFSSSHRVASLNAHNPSCDRIFFGADVGSGSDSGARSGRLPRCCS